MVRAAVLALLVLVSAASAEVPSPTLEGPVTGGHGAPFVASTMFDLAKVGYMQEEFFISGTATAWTSAAPLTSDGKWTAAPGATAAYKTRILVYRPRNPRKFSGTVLVEWLNTSGGLDAAADWLAAHTEMIREGIAWVGVSAQRSGVEGGGLNIGLPPMPLKMVDPERYGSLAIPSDSFSYDIYSQAGQAIRHPAGTSPLGPLKPKKVIAMGESQSAFRMVTYINAVHPLAGIYDGFFVHSRGASSAPLSESPQPFVAAPTPTFVRTDISQPVLMFQTETDLVLLNYVTDRQPDSERFRLWEVAGTSHVDAYTLVFGFDDLGRSPDAAKLIVATSAVGGLISCSLPFNSGPQHFVLDAAIRALNRWVRRGTPPPSAPRLEASVGPPPSIMRDANGNALGGVRTPQVDVPLAALSGEGQTGSVVCILLGTTRPFDAATLAALYPDKNAYVSAYRKATVRALRAGFLVKRDAELMKAAARMVDLTAIP